MAADFYSIVTLDDIMDALENGVIGGAEYLDYLRLYQGAYGGDTL